MSDPTTLFDYGVLDAETCQFVQQKTDDTHLLLKRTTEHIINIGQNLRTVKEKLPHGQFLQWIQAEFTMSRWTAQNFMRVAEKFGEKWGNFHHFPLSVLYELASPATSETILDLVQAGQVTPTLEAIKEAKEAERRTREAEQQARAETQVMQQQLCQIRKESEEQRTTIARLTDEITSLQERIATLSTSAVETRERETSQVPPQVTAQLEALRQQVQALTEQRDTLSQRVAQLGDEAKEAALKQNEGEQERRIRLNWHKTTSEFQSSVTKILAQWPSPLDTLAFEADDWTRLSQTKEVARHFLEACTALTQEKVIDSTTTFVHERTR